MHRLAVQRIVPRLATQIRPPRRAAILPLVAGLVMLAVAFFAGRSTASLQLSGLRATGTVIALRLHSAGDGNAYEPRVRFKTMSGDIVEFEGSGSNPPNHRVGQIVQVMYAADRPTHAMIDRGIRNWFIPAVFGLCGLPIVLFGARALARPLCR